MTIKFTGYLIEVSNDGSKHNKDMTLTIRILGAESNSLERELWDALEAGQPLEVSLGEEETITTKEDYNILYFKSLTNLIMDTKTMLEENWECLGAPFWNDNFIYQAFTRRKEK